MGFSLKISKHSRRLSNGFEWQLIDVSTKMVFYVAHRGKTTQRRRVWHPGTGLPVVHRGLVRLELGQSQMEVGRKGIDDRLVQATQLGQGRLDPMSIVHFQAGAAEEFLEAREVGRRQPVCCG